MTKVYGASDDLVEFEGDVDGEVGGYGAEDGILVALSDGSLLTVKYGKPHDGGLWGISVVRKGDLFDRVEECTEETDAGHSDVAHFKKGLKWAYATTNWEKVR